MKTNKLSYFQDELLKLKEIDVEREAEEVMHSEFQSETRPKGSWVVFICKIRALPSIVIPAKAGIHSASPWKCPANGVGFPPSRE
jgi:hypothetical protein